MGDCVIIYDTCAWYPSKPEEGISYPGLELQTVMSCDMDAESHLGSCATVARALMH